MNKCVNVIDQKEFESAREKAQALVSGELFDNIRHQYQLDDNLRRLFKIIKRCAISIIRETADVVNELCREKGYAAAYLKYCDIRDLLSEKFDNKDIKLDIRDLITIIAICNKVTDRMHALDTDYEFCEFLVTIDGVIKDPSDIQFR